MKFMLKKILLERDYVPDNKFDWSLGHGQTFPKVDKHDRHSSISSCGLNSEEANMNENPFDSNKVVNIKLLKDKYHSHKNLAQDKFKFARNSFMGRGSKIY